MIIESGVRSQESGVRSQESGVRERVYYFDFLRVLGAFAVIMIHLSGTKAEIFSFEWHVIKFYNALIRWAVPVFVMISGALFLGRDIPLRRLYGKNILRIFTAFIFWVFIYAVCEYLDKGNLTLKTFMDSHFHLWFLRMIIGLYIISPFLKKIVESELLTKYFLVLSFIFVFVLPRIVRTIEFIAANTGNLPKFSLPFVSGYAGYFLLGYFLNKIKLSEKLTRIIYIAGIFGFIATILITILLSLITHKDNTSFYGPLNVNILLESIAIFVFFKKNFNRPSKFIRTLSQYSFGAYLVHIAIMILAVKIGVSNLILNRAVSVLFTAIFIFIVSFIISGILNHIPVLKKYVV